METKGEQRVKTKQLTFMSMVLVSKKDYKNKQSLTFVFLYTVEPVLKTTCI